MQYFSNLYSIFQEVWHQTPQTIKTLLTAAIGAVFGAWLANRAQAKKAVVAELKALAAAHALCFSVANHALAVKRQHIRPTKERFDATLADFLSHQKRGQGTLNILLDLQTLSPTKFPTDVLEKIIFEKMSLDGEGIATAIALSTAADDLNNSIEFRNKLIPEFRSMTDADRISTYLGTGAPNARDDRFKGNIEAMASQVDNCIFFSMRLASLIFQSSKKLRKKSWHFGLPSKLKKPDWTRAQEFRLLPDEVDYADWLSGFRREPSRWERFADKWIGPRECPPAP